MPAKKQDPIPKLEKEKAALEEKLLKARSGKARKLEKSAAAQDKKLAQAKARLKALSQKVTPAAKKQALVQKEKIEGIKQERLQLKDALKTAKNELAHAKLLASVANKAVIEAAKPKKKKIKTGTKKSTAKKDKVVIVKAKKTPIKKTLQVDITTPVAKPVSKSKKKKADKKSAAKPKTEKKQKTKKPAKDSGEKPLAKKEKPISEAVKPEKPAPVIEKPVEPSAGTSTETPIETKATEGISLANSLLSRPLVSQPVIDDIKQEQEKDEDTPE